MPKQTRIIVCRSKSDRDLCQNGFAGEVERSCRVCGEAIVVTPHGQVFLNEPHAWFVCNPCGLGMAEEAKRHVPVEY